MIDTAQDVQALRTTRQRLALRVSRGDASAEPELLEVEACLAAAESAERTRVERAQLAEREAAVEAAAAARAHQQAERARLEAALAEATQERMAAYEATEAALSALLGPVTAALAAAQTMDSLASQLGTAPTVGYSFPTAQRVTERLLWALLEGVPALAAHARVPGNRRPLPLTTRDS